MEETFHPCSSEKEPRTYFFHAGSWVKMTFSCSLSYKIADPVGEFPVCEFQQLLKFVYFFNFGGHKSILYGHWYPSFGILVMSALGFKARVDPFYSFSSVWSSDPKLCIFIVVSGTHFWRHKSCRQVQTVPNYRKYFKSLTSSDDGSKVSPLWNTGITYKVKNHRVNV